MKLSQSTKERMINRILNAKFDSEEKSFIHALELLGDEIYAAIPDIEQATKLPRGWLPMRGYFNCNFGGLRSYINMTVERPVPFTHYEKRQDFASDHEFSLRFRAIEDAKIECSQRREALKRELIAVLRGVNTDKQLLSIWPEAIKWLPEVPTPVPAVQSVDRLRQLIGDAT